MIISGGTQAGLFNLLLEALRRYRAAGRLAEPEELKESIRDHRQETDPLAQWVQVEKERGNLVEAPGVETNVSFLHRANNHWCEDQGYRPLAAQRFGVSLSMLLKYEKRRSNGETLIIGWQWNGPKWNSASVREEWQQQAWTG